jgi:hypothetical protein
MSPIRGLTSEYKSAEAEHKVLFSFILVTGALAIYGMLGGGLCHQIWVLIASFCHLRTAEANRP